MENMETSELLELNVKLGFQIEDIKAQRQAIKKVIDARTLDGNLKAKLAGLSDPEKAKLAQLIQAEGIKSAEEIGKPS